MAPPKIEVEVSGKPGAPVLFFIHGWPDSARLWDAQVHHFGKTHRCAAVTMPLYGDPSKEEASHSAFGYNFFDLTEGLAEAVRSVSPDAPVTLVIHDWGSAWGFMLQAQHPDLVSRIVDFDIGPMNIRGLRGIPLMVMFGVAYQYLFIFFWFLHFVPFVGDAIAARLLGIMSTPAVKAAKKNGQYIIDPAAVPPRAYYPYFYFHWNFWLNIFTLGFLGNQVPALENSNPKTEPSCPMLFLYGADKKLMFHSQSWADGLAKRGNGSRSVSMATGHWVMLDEPNAVNKHMEEFLSEQAAGAK